MPMYQVTVKPKPDADPRPFLVFREDAADAARTALGPFPRGELVDVCRIGEEAPPRSAGPCPMYHVPSGAPEEWPAAQEKKPC